MIMATVPISGQPQRTIVNVSDKVVDANADGTKLKSYTKEKGFKGTLGAGYVFAF